MPAHGMNAPGSGVHVEKISVPLADAPAEPKVRSVSESEVGSQVRLKHNLITTNPEGKSILLPRGEVIAFADVPERWRNDSMIESVDEFRRDKVMLLHDLVCACPQFDGQSTVYREKLFAAFSLVDLKTIPNRIVETLIEGTDYLSQWDEDERRVKEFERQNAVEEFKMGGPDLPPEFLDPNRNPSPHPYER